MSGVDDRAVAPAIGRVLRRGSCGQDHQLVAGAGQLGQPGLYLAEPLGDQAGDVDAGRLAAAAAGVPLVDGLEGEPGGLGLPDERQALEDGRAVVAVPG